MWSARIKVWAIAIGSMTNLAGLILAGGESKRAGTDKGLKLLEGKSWVEIIQQKLTDIHLKAWVSINSSQLSKYRGLIAQDELIVDSSLIPGPLRGILTAHLKLPSHSWLVLACDMVDMKSDTITRLIQSYKEHAEHDFYVYKNEDFYQPFCGIYTTLGLEKVLKTYENKQERNYSMQHVFDSFNTYVLPIDKKDESFKNYNNK